MDTLSIPGYKVGDLIARGRSSLLYRVVDRAGQALACRVPLPGALETPNAGDSAFFRSARAAMALARSPFVVPLRDVGVGRDDSGEYPGGQVPYAVMDLIEGETLARRLERQGVLDATAALEVARGVCCALRDAHEAGLVHGDVRPSNVLLASDGRVLLTDFGPGAVDPRSPLTPAPGTYEMMAHEQFVGQASPQTDLFGLGAVLFTSLTGRFPLPPAPSGEVALREYMLAYREAPPPAVREVLPNIAPALERLIARALTRRSDGRFQSAAEMLGCIKQALTELEAGPAPAAPVAAAPPPVPPPVASPAKPAPVSPPPPVRSPERTVAAPRPAARPVAASERKGGGGKVVAILLGVLLLLGAMGAAAWFVVLPRVRAMMGQGTGAPAPATSTAATSAESAAAGPESGGNLGVGPGTQQPDVTKAGTLAVSNAGDATVRVVIASATHSGWARIAPAQSREFQLAPGDYTVTAEPAATADQALFEPFAPVASAVAVGQTASVEVALIRKPTTTTAGTTPPKTKPTTKTTTTGTQTPTKQPPVTTTKPTPPKPPSNLSWRHAQGKLRGR
jgi:eukaryotic-like serine/threonine-protein kinase